MKQPYLSVYTRHDEPELEVEIGSRTSYYPLTEKDLRQAGADLFLAGAQSWSCSSSVHHPGPRCQLDVESLVTEGFRAALEQSEAPKKSCIRAMFTFCQQAAFLNRLSEPERVAFDEMHREAFEAD